MLQFENGQIMSLLSILYVMPLARVTLYHRHPLAFVRRWGRVWRELSALGLSDARGGQHFHTVRVVKTGDARIEHEPNGGDLKVVFPGPENVLILPVPSGSTSTLFKIGACLQSEGVDNNRADVDLGSGARFHVILSNQKSSGRLSAKQTCNQVGDLSDLFVIPPAGEDLRAPTPQQKRMLAELHKSSPLAQMTGLFEQAFSVGRIELVEAYTPLKEHYRSGLTRSDLTTL